jgi:hypothetical protein
MRQMLFQFLLLSMVAGCEGRLVGPVGNTNVVPVRPPTDPAVVDGKPVNVPVQQLQRLTSRELDRTLAALTGETHQHARELLPNITLEPFDNQVEQTLASASFIEGVERMAELVTQETLADAKRRALVVPCTPTSNDDIVCFEKFLSTFGRSALRRSLSADEVRLFGSLRAQALERGDFYTAVGLAMRRFLSDPEFLFRVEVGQSLRPSISQLSAFELANRLSFFLQGRSPPTWLLDAAEQGTLNSKQGVKETAAKLIAEPEGKSHLQSFHAMWLGFVALPHDAALNQRMVTETTALIQRVVYEEPGDYRRLFLSTDTYLDADLAKHYGLPALTGTGFKWAPYADSGRKGILSHGTLLSNGAKQADTSPTLRGKWVRNRLFCQEIPPPPPNVAMDLPPAGTGNAVCKKDRLAAHTTVGSCAGCHKQMDPIGFGLEQYDRQGRFRTAEEGHPECTISGDGALAGIGDFRGVSGLADLMVSSGSVESCAVKQLFRFQTGRHDSEDDEGLLALFTKNFEASGRRYDQLLVDMVSTDSFTQRRTEMP